MITVREVMAAKVHDVWCSWMQSVLDRSVEMPDGSVIIPKELAQRWRRQAVTPYERLTEQEQASDKAIASDILDLLQTL